MGCVGRALRAALIGGVTRRHACFPRDDLPPRQPARRRCARTPVPMVMPTPAVVTLAKYVARHDLAGGEEIRLGMPPKCTAACSSTFTPR